MTALIVLKVVLYLALIGVRLARILVRRRREREGGSK
jgi:hypothetical protein